MILTDEDITTKSFKLWSKFKSVTIYLVRHSRDPVLFTIQGRLSLLSVEKIYKSFSCIDLMTSLPQTQRAHVHASKTVYTSVCAQAQSTCTNMYTRQHILSDIHTNSYIHAQHTCAKINSLHAQHTHTRLISQNISSHDPVAHI